MSLKMIRLEQTTSHIQSVQEVFENASDYLLKVSGEVAQANDGEDVFMALPESFDRKSKHVLGLYLQNEMIGFVDCLIGFPEFNKAHIGLLLIKESYQRRGLGEKAYALIEDYLLQYPAMDTLRLSLVETNKSAMIFWEKCGFRATGTVKPYTHKKVISQVLIMEKSFNK